MSNMLSFLSNRNSAKHSESTQSSRSIRLKPDGIFAKKYTIEFRVLVRASANHLWTKDKTHTATEWVAGLILVLPVSAVPAADDQETS